VKRSPIEVAGVIRAGATEYLRSVAGRVSSAKLRVLRDLAACRTAALGGHVDACEDCGRQQVSYNSCRNRHCPKCQGKARAEWLTAREADLLPAEYFHVVFTLPDEIAAIALQNKKEVYGILLRTSATTLKDIALDPQHLGAEIGFISVLHTWGQNLLHHPHVHCVVPGGGLSPDGRRWVPCRPGFFLPVRVLSRLFRNRFVDALVSAFEGDRLRFQGCLEHLQDERSFRALLASCRRTEWVVYSKPPFGGPRQVLKYLARYTHRVAIANSRLLAMNEREVTFRWKDYAHRARNRSMTLGTTEFIRRFLLHVLPKGFPRIRHYGLLANRSEKLQRCVELLSHVVRKLETPQEPPTEIDSGRCPACGSRAIRHFELDPAPVAPIDSS
jgi:hypothetical protein